MNQRSTTLGCCDVLGNLIGLQNKVNVDKSVVKNSELYTFINTSTEQSVNDNDLSEIGKAIRKMKQHWQVISISSTPTDCLFYQIMCSFMYYINEDLIKFSNCNGYQSSKKSVFTTFKDRFITEIYNQKPQKNCLDKWKTDFFNFFIILKGTSGKIYILVEPQWIELYKTLSGVKVENYNGCFIYPIISRQFKYSHLPLSYNKDTDNKQKSHQTLSVIDVNSNTDVFILISKIKKWISIYWLLQKLEKRFKRESKNTTYKMFYHTLSFISSRDNYHCSKLQNLLNPFTCSNYDWDHYSFLFSYLYNYIKVIDIFKIVISFFSSSICYEQLFAFPEVVKLEETQYEKPNSQNTLKRKIEEIYPTNVVENCSKKIKESQESVDLKMGNDVLGFIFSATYINLPHCMKRDVFDTMNAKFFSKTKNDEISIYPIVAKVLYLMDLYDGTIEINSKQYVNISKPSNEYIKQIVDTQTEIRNNLKHQPKKNAIIDRKQIFTGKIVIVDIFMDEDEDTPKTKEDIIEDDLLLIDSKCMVLALYDMCKDHIKKNFQNTIFSSDEIYSILFSIKLLGVQQNESVKLSKKATNRQKSVKNIIAKLERYEMLNDWCTYEERVKQLYSNNQQVLNDRKTNYTKFYKTISNNLDSLEKNYHNFLNIFSCSTNNLQKSVVYNSNYHIWSGALEIFSEVDISVNDCHDLLSRVFEISKDPPSYKTYNSYIINPKEFVISQDGTPQSFIVNANDIVQTKRILKRENGKSNRIVDYNIKSDNAIWDTDALMVINFPIKITNIKYEEYEQVLYNKLKKHT